MRRLLFCLVLTLCSCDLIGLDECEPIALPAVAVTVVDSIAGTPVERVIEARFVSTAVDRRVIQDPLTMPGGNTVRLELVGAGTYDVTIVVEGYRPWVRTGIRVTDDGCRLRTVTAIARLVPAERQRSRDQ